MKKIILYISVALASLVLNNYLTSCNVVNKSRSIEKKSIDSSSVTSFDSGKLKSYDSASVKKEASVDSSKTKHVETKKLILTFDTSHPAAEDKSTPYKYEINGKQISTPNKILSATIDDSNEDDSFVSKSSDKSDSVKVNLLDSGRLKKDGNTHKVAEDNIDNFSKNSWRTSPLFIGGIILIMIIAGYFGGKKIGFFK